MTQRESVLVLHTALGMGMEAIGDVMAEFSPLSSVFGASEEELTEVPGIGPRRAERILQVDPQKELERLNREIEESGCRAITILDEGFPSKLKGKKGVPAVLFCQGDEGSLSEPMVAIVGTRRASGYGNQMAYSMARELTIQGVMVLSGMAIGIDTFAHQGALEAGRTVAVLGSGLGRVYPPQNKGLAKRIRENGLLLSPFAPNTEPARWTFPKRNRVMAALAEAVVVVEAGERSGALLTAQYAKEMGIPVFAVPGRVDRSQGRGVARLLKEGAKVAAGAEDVLEHLSISLKVDMNTASEEPETLEGKEMLVWKTLENADLPPEVIAQRAGMDLSEIWEVLLEMEMKGIISQGRGGVYSRRVM